MGGDDIEYLQARVSDAEELAKLALAQKAELVQELEKTKASEERASLRIAQQEKNIDKLHDKQDRWLKRCEELRDPLT